MDHARVTRFTEEQYLLLENASRERHEFIDGCIVAMAGASFRHNVIVANLVRAIGNRLDGKPCVVLSSEQRVNVSATGDCLYPDVVIVCGGPQFSAKDPMAITNPTVVFEVLSKSTERRDVLWKSELYRAVPSLTHYVAVRQDQRHAELFRRTDGDRWESSHLVGDGGIALASVDVTLSFDELYARVELPAE